MTDDRELLEMAAKAAGIDVRADRSGIWIVEDDGSPVRRWNPLTDDGDALRLAVKLKMGVDPRGAGACCVVFPGGARPQIREPHYGDDADRATRRAIVRAAAEIGRAK